MKELVASALKGTMHGVPAMTLPDYASSIADASAGRSAERRLLLLAGSTAICRAAGRMPNRDVPPLTPPEEDPRHACSGKATEQLRALLAEPALERNRILLLEAATLLTNANLRLPDELLPAALDVKDDSLRQRLQPTLGTTAIWLAQFNDAWNWAKGGWSPEVDLDRLREAFDDSPPNQRIRIFTFARTQNADAARAWLEECFGKEKPDHRTALLGCLRKSLSTADEPFLESALGDRSEKVRTEAFDLLARLPNSRISKELVEQTSDLFAVGASGILRRLRVDVRWPNPPLIDWLAKMLSTPKQAAGIDKSAWLVTAIGHIDPVRWSQNLDRNAETFVGAIESEWEDSVLLGLAVAASVFNRTEFMAAAWRRLLAGGKRRSILRDSDAGLLTNLLEQMPADMAAVCVLPMVESAQTAGFTWLQACAALKRPWSSDLGIAFLKQLERNAGDPPANVERLHEWLGALLTAGAFLPGTCLSRAARPLPLPPPGDYRASTWSQVLNQFSDLVRLRKTLHEEIHA